MKCAWDAYINLLPPWMRNAVDKQGSSSLLELRLRIGDPPVLKCLTGTSFLHKCVTLDDLNYCINAASRYSPWRASTIAMGYITAQGGHRVGICGDTVFSKDGRLTIVSPTSLCLRVARDFDNLSNGINQLSGSILILGRPGTGKTTLLRDLIRKKSDQGVCIGVVDEKEEIFPKSNGNFCFSVGQNTDVLSGCDKKTGINILLRSMTPDTIAVDEVSMQEDCESLISAGWCGVNWLATVHAENIKDLYNRAIYRPLAKSGMFDYAVVLKSDKSYYTEELKVCY